MGGVVADVWFLFFGDEAAFLLRLVLRGGAARWEGGHGQVDSGDSIGVAQGELSANRGAPVAAVVEELVVAEAGHEVYPDVGDGRGTESHPGWDVGPSVAGQGGGDDVEGGRVGVGWFGQLVDDLVEVVDG